MYIILSRRGIDIDRYSAIKGHLQQFRRRLEPKPDSWNPGNGKWLGRAPGDYKWYELQASPSHEFMEAVERPKIVYQEIQFHSWFALDQSGAVPNNKVFFLPTNDACLLAILNSPLMWWVLTRTLPHMKDEALNPAGFIMEQLSGPAARPHDSEGDRRSRYGLMQRYRRPICRGRPLSRKVRGAERRRSGPSCAKLAEAAGRRIHWNRRAIEPDTYISGNEGRTRGTQEPLWR
jgi:TaqI-like C-terminal specificity domain